jgi:hypothetical protein
MVDRTMVPANAGQSKDRQFAQSAALLVGALLVHACSSVGDQADRQTVGEHGSVGRPNVPVNVRSVGNGPAATGGKVSRKATESSADANPSRGEFPQLQEDTD